MSNYLLRDLGLEGILKLEPEDLAAHLLQMLNADPDKVRSLTGFAEEQSDGRAANVSVPHGQSEPLKRAIAEAWSWLARDGLLAPYPGHQDGWFVTRRGKQLRDAKSGK